MRQYKCPRNGGAGDLQPRDTGGPKTQRPKKVFETDNASIKECLLQKKCPEKGPQPMGLEEKNPRLRNDRRMKTPRRAEMHKEGITVRGQRRPLSFPRGGNGGVAKVGSGNRSNLKKFQPSHKNEKVWAQKRGAHFGSSCSNPDEPGGLNPPGRGSDLGSTLYSGMSPKTSQEKSGVIVRARRPPRDRAVRASKEGKDMS